VAAARPIDRFWEGFFGTALRPGTQVVPHAALVGYTGVWIFVREPGCIVSAPPAWCDRIGAALADATIDSLLSPDGYRALFGCAFEETIGPSWLGWLPPKDFRPAHSDAVRTATAASIRELTEACSEEDRVAAGLVSEGAFGWFDDPADAGGIQAAASPKGWGEIDGQPVVGPGVLSRRPGCGKPVVSAVCDEALQAGRLVVYQTLLANERAVGIARALGFAFHASHVAIRLADPASPG
jgi:hypothetical protein